jgi:SAM-dependent methyltransferase
MAKVKERQTCRSCGSPILEPVLSLGNIYVSDFLDDDSAQKNIAPLDLVLCNAMNGGCGLVQLRHTVPSDFLYRQYWYKSGISETIRTDLKDTVDKAQKLINLKDGDIVVDIGCNDGTMLRYYSGENITKVGFEPAYNLVKEAEVGKNIIINDFFNHESFRKKFGNKKSKIITAISMFYDLDNPNEFLEDIVKTMDKDGIFIIQQNYLVNMLENNAFDNICHEHLEYYSLFSLENLLKNHNLEVFDVELNSINGGSIRTYIKLKENSIRPFNGAEKRIDEIRQKEKNMELHNSKPYLQFVGRVENIKMQLYSFISQEIKHGKKVMVCGASTRGNTTLQYCNLDYRLLDSAVDKNPEKWGKRTVETKIPIAPMEHYMEVKPDYVLVLPWHFFEEIRLKESKYLPSKTKFIVPMPSFRIVDSLH